MKPGMFRVLVLLADAAEQLCRSDRSAARPGCPHRPRRPALRRQPSPSTMCAGQENPMWRGAVLCDRTPRYDRASPAKISLSALTATHCTAVGSAISNKGEPSPSSSAYVIARGHAQPVLRANSHPARVRARAGNPASLMVIDRDWDSLGQPAYVVGKRVCLSHCSACRHLKPAVPLPPRLESRSRSALAHELSRGSIEFDRSFGTHDLSSQ